MATFGLVHGAWHGGWSFELLAPELEARGHRVVAPDLPCDDPAAGVSRYAEVVAEALAGEEDIVLVGKSLGGLTIPLVPALLPVRHLVYVAALVPHPGLPFDVRWREGALVRGFGADAKDELGRSYWTDRDAFFRHIYHDCPRALSDRAFERHRPQSPAPTAEPCPLDRLPDVPATYVVCADDRVVNTEWSRRVAREELGVEPTELEGGHAPGTARPAVLADLLVEAVLA